MDSPLDIANSRLARGEITAEQHTDLVRRLAAHTPPAGNAGPPPLPPAVPPALPQGAATPAPPVGLATQPPRKRPVWPWVVGGVGLLAAIVVAAGLIVTDGLSLGNLQADGQTVSVKLANSAGKSGDVLLWITQDSLKKCERIIRVSAQSTYNIRFECPTLASGRFTLQPQWAEYDPDTAAVAERIDVTN